jgi:hypothetical protein
VLDNAGNLTLGMGGSAAAYRFHMTDTLGFRANSVNIVGMKGSGFGYGPSGYQALVIGATGTTNQSTCIGYDPSGNPSGNFSGDGSEIVLRNFAQFIQPTAANTNFHRGVISLRDGNVGIQSDPTGWSGYGIIQIGDNLSSGLGFIGSDAAGSTVTDIGHGAYWDGSNWKYTANSIGAARYRMTGANAGSTHQWFTSAGGFAGNNISFGDAKMTLDASGNLLVGGTSTSTIPTLNRGVYLQSTTNNDVIGYSLHIPEGSNNRRGSMFLDDANGIFGWDVTASSGIPYYAWRNAGRTDMVLDANGYLAIGTTTTTSARVSIQNSDAINELVFRGTEFTNVLSETTGGMQLGISSTTGTAALAFLTLNTERGRFTAGGYFKASNDGTYFGSTSSYHELRSTGAAGDWNTVVTNTTATGANAYGIRIAYTGSAPNGTGNAFLSCDDNASGGTTRATIRSNGGLANYQANDVNLSDERTKKDIAPLGSMWDKFKAIEIVTFKYKDQTHDDDNIGVIAQQVESVAPEFVDVDGWGETPEDGVPLKSIYTADMYHAAIKALQEAMARIESLEADMAALKGAK